MIDKSCEACQKTTLASSFSPCFAMGGRLNCACECHDDKKMIDNTKTPELLPCPFCGSKAVVFGEANAHMVQCVNRKTTCPVNMRTHYREDIREAINLWNERQEVKGS